MNVNDEKPQIDRSSLPTISLTENQDNATVLKLSALDKDGLGQLTFSFGGTIDQETFPFYFSPSESNDSCTSVFLSVNGSRLDYERQTFWQLQIVVEDQPDPWFPNLGPFSDMVSLNVVVNDTSDNKPVWQSYPSIKRIEENSVAIVSLLIKQLQCCFKEIMVLLHCIG